MIIGIIIHIIMHIIIHSISHVIIISISINIISNTIIVIMNIISKVYKKKQTLGPFEILRFEIMKTYRTTATIIISITCKCSLLILL